MLSNLDSVWSSDIQWWKWWRWCSWWFRSIFWSQVWTAATGHDDGIVLRRLDADVSPSSRTSQSRWFWWFLVIWRWPGDNNTIWLFNIAMERSTMLLIGKPSISMGHLCHGELLNNQIYNIITVAQGFIPYAMAAMALSLLQLCFVFCPFDHQSSLPQTAGRISHSKHG